MFLSYALQAEAQQAKQSFLGSLLRQAPVHQMAFLSGQLYRLYVKTINYMGTVPFTFLKLVTDIQVHQDTKGWMDRRQIDKQMDRQMGACMHRWMHG